MHACMHWHMNVCKLKHVVETCSNWIRSVESGIWTQNGECLEVSPKCLSPGYGRITGRQKHEQLVLRARNLPVARYGPRNTCYGQVGHNGARNGARNSPVHPPCTLRPQMPPPRASTVPCLALRRSRCPRMTLGCSSGEEAAEPRTAHPPSKTFGGFLCLPRSKW